MDDAQIRVEGLSKTFRVPVRPEGLRASLNSLVRRTYSDVEAVRDISFHHRGRGDGRASSARTARARRPRSRCWPGCCTPPAGEARVAGFMPWERQPGLPAPHQHGDGQQEPDAVGYPAAGLLSACWARSMASRPTEFKRDARRTGRRCWTCEELLTKPVRNLSLGERMKCELVAGLLHRPQVLFLDEPTLGLDVSMQSRLRRFLAEYNRRHGVTVILTSHYMADVLGAVPARDPDPPRAAALRRRAERAGAAAGAVQADARRRLQTENGRTGQFALPPGVELIAARRRAASPCASRAPRPRRSPRTCCRHLPVADLAVEDPPIEAVIDQIYQEGAVRMNCARRLGADPSACGCRGCSTAASSSCWPSAG